MLKPESLSVLNLNELHENRKKAKTESQPSDRSQTEKLLMTRKNYQVSEQMQKSRLSNELTKREPHQCLIVSSVHFHFSPHFPRTSLISFLSFRSLLDLVFLSFYRPENKKN
jgi:hypothetical protein